MSVEILPLTAEKWPLLEDLFGKQGAHGGCWCMYFRMPSAAWRASRNEDNKQAFAVRVKAGPPPGLIAVEDGRAIGWMQIGPRADVSGWNSPRRASAPLTPGDAEDPGVWAVSCFYVRVKSRRNGLMHRLLTAGLNYARETGARLVEACPIEKSRGVSSADLYVGSAQVFEKAGFERMAERRAGRPLMRLVL